jgi:hypothetical protein
VDETIPGKGNRLNHVQEVLLFLAIVVEDRPGLSAAANRDSADRSPEAECTDKQVLEEGRGGLPVLAVIAGDDQGIDGQSVRRLSGRGSKLRSSNRLEWRKPFMVACLWDLDAYFRRITCC